jgi:hypothetical protein
MGRDRVTIQEAALRLGVKDDAIRKRIQRGSLEHEKGPDGRVYVYLDASLATAYDGQDNVATWDKTKDTAPDATQDALMASLQDQVEYLRSVLQEERDARRRADMIIAQLTQANASLADRVPELDAPAPQRSEDAPEGVKPRSATEGPYAAQERPSTEEEPPRRRSWREFFGFGG